MGNGNFLRNIIFAYAPIIGKKDNNKRELRRIIKHLKRNEKPLVDPVQLKMRPLFCELILELSEISKRLKVLYESNINSSEEDYCEFELKLCSTILENGNMAMTDLDLSDILQTAHAQGQGGVNTLDRIFKSRMKYFTNNNFRKYRINIERNQRFNDLSLFNFSGIIDIIPINKNNIAGSVPAEKILSDLKDLYFLSVPLPVKKPVLKDDIIIIAYKMNELESSYSLEKIQSDISRIYEIFEGSLNAKFLRDTIRIVSRDLEMEFPENKVISTFPKEIYDSIIEKYRVDRHKFLHMENEKLLQSRMTALFKDRNLAEIQIYNVNNSEIFHNAGLPNFKYIIPMRIIKSYIVFL